MQSCSSRFIALNVWLRKCTLYWRCIKGINLPEKLRQKKKIIQMGKWRKNCWCLGELFLFKVSFSFSTHREPWLLRPCPAWLTPPSSPDRTRSVSTRRAAGRGKQGAWKWWTRLDTSLDTSMQGHTRRRFKNLHKNPCEILHPAVNAKPDSIKHKGIFHFPLRVRLFSVNNIEFMFLFLLSVLLLLTGTLFTSKHRRHQLVRS